MANSKPYKHTPVAGTRYGKLRIIQRVSNSSTTSQTLKVQVRVECDCGQRLTIPYYYLIRKSPKPKTECGKCGPKSLQAKHPLEYRCWYMMNVRCTNPDHVAFQHYGGRGITVCDEWSWDNEDGFRNFLEHIGKRPSLKYSIERIDNDVGYRPFHPQTGEIQVKWATAIEQRANQRPYTYKRKG